MNYFNYLPLIISTDYKNSSIVANNILTRTYILPSLLKNITLFYDYDVREGDTPELIAYKYYKDPFRYWLVLYSNGIIDPQSEWPLTNNVLSSYIVDKYKQDTANSLNIPVSSVSSGNVMSYVTATVHHYEKVISVTDSSSHQLTSTTIQIDKTAYDSLMESTSSVTFENNITATMTVSKNAINILDYEISRNESKRKISILNSMYVNDIEKQFKILMRAP